MSYCVATSIVLTKNEIIIHGGDNNVVPRDSYTAKVPRTQENMRKFIKEDLLGGCVKPLPSANDYFWWWLMQRPWWERYSYSTITDHECDRLAEYVIEEYEKRKKRNRPNYALHFVDDIGNHLNYVKRVKGAYYMCDKPQPMSFYHAVYLNHKDGAWLSQNSSILGVQRLSE